MTKEVAAWFLAHSGVDPQAEIDKILRVSGSPYEIDSGSLFNDKKTADKGVFVTNRYDWGYYDTRSEDEIVISEELEGPFTLASRFEAAGRVDLAAAKSMVLRWKDQRSGQRELSDGGAWLHIPGGEYMFGRFGFDDNRVAARSFLFFTTNTCFTRTAFKGLEQSLRKEETLKERFERRLQEGCDFSGIEALREISQPIEEPGIVMLSPPPPPRADCFGPYDKSEHVLRAEEINAILVYRHARQLKAVMTSPILELVEPWVESAFDVANEMILSYRQRTVVPRMGNRGVAAAAELLFPRHTEKGDPRDLGTWCYRHFTQPDAFPIPNFDSKYVNGQIASFLSRYADPSVVFEDECIAGITSVVTFILAEVFELADVQSFELSGEGAKIMPSDVRMAIYNDPELRDYLQFSKVYWEGRDCSLPLER